MQVGDVVRVKHPTGGILPGHSFRVMDVPVDTDGWVVVRGDIGGLHGVRDFKFHRYSLEVIGAAPDQEVTAVHPATLHRMKVERALLKRIGDYKAAGVLPLERSERRLDLVWSALRSYRDACYAEVDDGHGLGKAGLDAARGLLDGLIPYGEAYIADEDHVAALRRLIEGGS